MEPEQIIALIAALLALTGSQLGAIAKYKTAEGFSTTRALSGGAKVLITFGGVVAFFGIVVVTRYWQDILFHADRLMFAFGLFLTMVAGMFVQVIAANYRANRELLDISATQLVFPLLFSLVVFYPIWTLAGDASRDLFSFYAAFLNGYFWESVVTAAKNPTLAGK